MPGARSQARYADIAASPPSRHEGAGKTPSVSWTWPLTQVTRTFGPRPVCPLAYEGGFYFLCFLCKCVCGASLLSKPE